MSWYDDDTQHSKPLCSMSYEDAFDEHYKHGKTITRCCQCGWKICKHLQAEKKDDFARLWVNRPSSNESHMVKISRKHDVRELRKIVAEIYQVVPSCVHLYVDTGALIVTWDLDDNMNKAHYFNISVRIQERQSEQNKSSSCAVQ